MNRRGFDYAITQAAATGSGFGAVVAIDLDEFKVINDRFGHAAGDRVLIEVAEILRSHCEQFGPVARMGGEEFLILVKQTHAMAVETLAETLRVAIGGLRLTGFPTDFRITASMGVANAVAGEPIEDTCRKADVALYVAKGSGRNCVVSSANNDHNDGMAGGAYE